MTKYSEVVIVVWLFAAWEARSKKHANIQIEHLFIGICRAVSQEPIESLRQLRLRQDLSGLLESETLPILKAFNELRIDAVDVCRRLRELIGTGSHQYADSDIIHRSKDCKLVFERAGKILGDSSSILRVGNLLRAVLEIPGPLIRKALREASGDEKALLRAICAEGVFCADSPAGDPAELPTTIATPMLDKFGIDLTALARENKLSPMIGRRYELMELLRVLLRLEKNCPVLIGEAGVGKTRIVHGLAARMASGNINSERLRGKRLIEVKLNSIVAGTSSRGEFEQRCEGIIQEARTSPDVTLFFDEIHTLVGAGNAQGALDAANILKPFLARGELRCIGATSIAEYRRHIEPDAALNRRFEAILVAEPSVEEAREILNGLKPRFEKAHDVTIESAAIDSAVHLSVRYMIGRRLPDKAITVLEDACIRSKTKDLSYCADQTTPLTPEVSDLEVAAVVSERSGIALERIRRSEKDRMLLIPEQLNEAIIGQDEAVAKICQSLRQTAAGLSDFNKPLGVFLFVGPSGVGKTQAAKTLAGILFDSEENFIHLDMAEFSEKHSVSKLIGAPPGYVGYGDEGRLTGKLRDRPYTVVLLDEIEKAHPDVLHLFLSLFDEGRITDAMGRRVDGRSAVFIMTSNVGAAGITDPPVGFQNGSGAQTDLSKVILQEVQKSFSAEFLNRTKVVFFKPLGPGAVEAIGRRLVRDSVRRFEEKGVKLLVEEDALLWVCRQGYDRRYGARHLQRAVNDFVLGPATEMWLSNEAPKGSSLTVVLRGEKLDYMVAGREQVNDPDATQPL